MTLFAKTVVEAQPWLVDPKCLPIPWRPVERKPKLKLAVMWHDGMVAPTPPVARALAETVEKLKAAGHEIVQWDPVLHPKGLEILVRRIRFICVPVINKIGTNVCRRWRGEC